MPRKPLKGPGQLERLYSRCAYCGALIKGEEEYSIHRDGFGKGPEVALCVECGSKPAPTCEQIWARIAQKRTDA